MPRYRLPPLKESRDEEKNEVAMDSSDSFPSRWDREIRIPVNKAIIDAVKAGQEVEVTLRGKVTEVESHDREDGKQSRNMVSLELMDVEIYEEEPEESMEKGYGRATKFNKY